MREVTFFIPGFPVPKQSFRYGAKGNWQPKRVIEWTNKARWIARAEAKKSKWERVPEGVPVLVRLWLGWAWPKAVKKSVKDTVALRTSTPDVDNVQKAVLDALAHLWHDDRQVAVVIAVKLNVPRGKEGVGVKIERIEDEDAISKWTGRADI
jgi:Holliday junction resolvase RusA-like endonuclease